MLLDLALAYVFLEMGSAIPHLRVFFQLPAAHGPSWFLYP